MLITNFILPVLILVQFEWPSLYAINPCDYKKCRKNEVPCLEVVAKSEQIFFSIAKNKFLIH